jgi:hypothetical protein
LEVHGDTCRTSTTPVAAAAAAAAQDLANLMFSLAVWKTSVSQPFLQRTLAAFRGQWGAQGTTPAAMVSTPHPVLLMNVN